MKQGKERSNFVFKINMEDLKNWIDAFNSKLKTKAFEQFSILICDFKKCQQKQKDLLYKILFIDHKAANYWSDYIEFVVNSFSDRRLQLQRLINKSFELLSESENINNINYVKIHLIAAQLKGYLIVLI